MLYHKLFIISALICTQIIVAQTSLQSFTSKFVRNDKGGTVIFCGDDKQIDINLFGSKFENVETENQEILPNRYFLSVDDMVIQSALIPVPKNVKDVYGLENLNLEQQRQILSGYIDYEISYMNSDQKTAVKDIFFAEGDINSRKYFIWNYFYKSYDQEKDVEGDLVTGQFCLSTLVFDQVLTVNIAMLKNYSINPVEILRKITENIETRVKKCEQQ